MGMTKRIVMLGVAVLFLASLGVTAGGKEGTWVGWVTDTHCGAPKDPAKHSAGCVTKCVKDGASYALYTPADKKVYAIANADKVAEHAGHHVKISGTLDGEKITIKSVEPAGEKGSGL
jgi:hypothetical protein